MINSSSSSYRHGRRHDLALPRKSVLVDLIEYQGPSLVDIDANLPKVHALVPASSDCKR